MSSLSSLLNLGNLSIIAAIYIVSTISLSFTFGEYPTKTPTYRKSLTNFIT